MTNWTSSVRERLEKALPINQLLPDSQPDYVRSAVYLFGAISLASLAFVILSGIVLAIFGPQWWHTNGVGHFFNSLHLWSVQAFMFFMVVHLWGKFFMGSWRDGRARTWISGVLTFVISIVAAFTGYLSQTNFDSQWIAVSAKDAINGIGIGGLFNVLNFGQMYSFHIIILPVVVVGLVAFHIIQVRLRGVVRPYPVTGETRTPYTKGMTQAEYYSGVKKVPYDLLREVTLVGAGILVIIVAFAGVFSSPDDKPLTMQGVAASNPVGFVTVSLSELAGNSDIAQYGQPYNTQTGSVQYLGPISLQQIGGVSIPIDTVHVYVLDPLATVKSADVQAAVRQFGAASAAQQTTWETNYATALGKADGTLDSQGNLHLATGDYGPLPIMFDSLLTIARSGALDGLLLTDGGFYQTDYTKPLLFLNEDALPTQAGALNLQGGQWGMMNETGAYPGQAWLWLYTFWYQVPAGPFNGPNADVAVLLVMAVLTLALILVPIIPGLNRLPELIPIHKLIWRQHYREVQAEVKAKQSTTVASTPK